MFRQKLSDSRDGWHSIDLFYGNQYNRRYFILILVTGDIIIFITAATLALRSERLWSPAIAGLILSSREAADFRWLCQQLRYLS